MNKNNNLVVVLTRSYSTGLSVVRSLGSAGYTVDLLASAHKSGVTEVAAKSKYVRKYKEVVSKKVKEGEDDELLNELINFASGSSKKPLLFPTDDYTASVMDSNRSLLSQYYIMPFIKDGEDGSMIERMDKTFQSKLAKKAGLLTPKEWIISLRSKISIPQNMTYPCFCKPIQSISGYKREMKICKNQKELKSHLRKLKGKFDDRDILVQEYLNIEREIDISGVCLDDRIIVPAIIEKTDVARYEVGVSLAGKILPFERLGKAQKKIINMLKELHYTGMFDMELNVVGNKLYFNEINLRSGGPNFAYFMSGANLPALYADEMFKGSHSIENEKIKKYGKSFIYEKVAWEDYMNGFMSKREMKKRIKNADIKIVSNKDDPEPGKLFKKNIKKQAKKRIASRRIKKIKSFFRRIKSKAYWKNLVKERSKIFKKDLHKAELGIVKYLRKFKHIIMGYPQTKKKNRRRSDAQKPRVLVAGRNYCSNLCMARSLGQAGYEVEVLRIFQVRPPLKNFMKKLRPDAYSKYIKAYYVCVSQRDSQRILNRLIKIADPDNKMLLIPADDLVADIADENLNILKKYYKMPNIRNKEGEISRLMSKQVQKKIAKKAGLPILPSCVIRTVDGEFEIPDTISYPCFVKPNISKNSSKSRMRKCNSRNKLKKTIKRFSRNKDVEILVEDFIKIDKEYSLLGLSTKDGVVAPGYFVAEQSGHKEHRGVAMTGRLLPISEEQELIDKLISFVKNLGYEGLFDIDLIRTTQGKLYFIELNLRYGASGYAVTRCGANLPGMFADYMLLDKPIDLNCKIDEPGKVFISEKIMIDEYINGYYSMKEIKEYMDKADIHFVMDDEDPKPYNHFKKFYLAARIMKILLKIKRNRKKAHNKKALD